MNPIETILWDFTEYYFTHYRLELKSNALAFLGAFENG
jgi:hypothetical protein